MIQLRYDPQLRGTNVFRAWRDHLQPDVIHIEALMRMGTATPRLIEFTAKEYGRDMPAHRVHAALSRIGSDVYQVESREWGSGILRDSLLLTNVHEEL